MGISKNKLILNVIENQGPSLYKVHEGGTNVFAPVFCGKTSDPHMYNFGAHDFPSLTISSLSSRAVGALS